MADTRVGWEIYGKFYPHNGVDALRHGDYRLVRMVTGLTTDEFVNGDDLTGSESGWIAVAFAQAHPEMTLDQVARMMDMLKIDAVTRVGFELDEEEGQSPPPEGEIPSISKSSTTDGSSEATPETPSPGISGTPVSRIGAED